jgi:hypothetical protein
MKKFLRWVALALFCALCGFAGAVGGISLMSDDLRGEQGPPGLQGNPGVEGLPGAIGERGPRGRAANVKQMEARITRVRSDLNKLGPRVDELETDIAAVPTDGCTAGTPVEVVTGAALGIGPRGHAVLDVEKGSVTPCQ